MRSQRHRRTVRDRGQRRPWLFGLFGVALCVAAVGVAMPWSDPTRAAGPVGPTGAPPTRLGPPAPAVASPAPPAIGFPVNGGRRYVTAPGDPAVVGSAGPLLRFRVEVETDITELDPADFGAFVLATYGDPEGWTAGGRWRFQRVGADQPADFVLYLVTPGTRDALCRDNPDGYTSCREGDKVILNVDRWVHAVPNYGAPLDLYRRYMINHETGHRLGFGHELCPGAGQPAPVMQQQTLGLHGCLANAWPYPGGIAYHGTSGNYPS